MQFTINLNPVTKKNSSRIAGIGKKCFACGKGERQIILPSKQYSQYEKDCKMFMPKLKEPIQEPVNIKALFYMKTRRKVDLVNLQEALLDVLVKYRVISDDNSSVVESMDNSRVFYDKDNPRTEVTIETMDNDMDWWGEKGMKK